MDNQLFLVLMSCNQLITLRENNDKRRMAAYRAPIFVIAISGIVLFRTQGGQRDGA
jgi:hypothetical protein